MKQLKIFMCFIIILCTAFTFYGCNRDNEDYPVTIGNITFEESPERIAVISPNMADIIDCIGYDVKVTMVSDDVITENLSDKPSCGDSIDPDDELIIQSDVDAVIADDNISDGVIKKLEDKGIKVVQFHYGNSQEDIVTTYKSIGAILGGAKGREKAEKAFYSLIEHLGIYKNAVKKIYSASRLLYLSGTGPYVTAIAGSWYNTLLNYSGVKVVSNQTEIPNVTLSEIADLDVDYLIYDGKTYDDLKSKESLKDATFLIKGHSKELAKDRLKLQGVTAIENIKSIISLIDKEAIEIAEENLYKIKDSSETETNTEVTTQTDATKNTTKKVNATEKATTGTEGTTVASSATEATTATVPPTTKPDYELQSKYGVKFTTAAIASMVKEKENKYIKAMQQRLSSLGYIEKENTTGYFGDLTEKAIRDFEKNNKIKEDGKASEKMLQLLFSSKAKKK